MHPTHYLSQSGQIGPEIKSYILSKGQLQSGVPTLFPEQTTHPFSSQVSHYIGHF